MKDHFLLCTFEDLHCEYCSTSIINRYFYKEHDQICPKAPVSCALKKFGCDVEVNLFCSQPPECN